ncbi:hypothetical protein C6Q15_28215 [Burkholderia multivorans]|uniref:Bacteriophage protein n=1 Tax=Burkholderia multivorans TaxID=87883 RepID=A0A2S9MBC1_9BURK|nr:hypothetical protein [Burkholderia multivorans]MBU9635470.1 hypothetical protein [Burkholderia multivorans]PRF08626.1 hypothetical protein C6Q07_11015 [Burkholderia multivorans]PRF54652.1 hypothetical protein C6Q15_28215 [Burkholderia multivorans]
MIDQDKMRALAHQLRAWNWLNDPLANQAADAIDLLLAEVEATRIERDGQLSARIGYASEFPLDAEGLPDIGNIHANIRKLKAELEAAAADKRDAERYRALREFGKDGVNMKPPVEHVHAMLYSHLAGTIPASRAITGDELDRAIDAALAQRQGEGS